MACTSTRPRARNAAPRRLTDDQRDRAAALIGLAAAVASLHSRSWPAHREALIDAAHDGLVQAAASWTPDGGCSFRNHAWRRIRGACRDYLRNLARQRRRPQTHESDWLDTIPDPAPDPRDRLGHEEEFRRILRWFPQPHRRIIDSVCRRGLNQAQTAAVMGLTQGRISAILAEARDIAHKIEHVLN